MQVTVLLVQVCAVGLVVALAALLAGYLWGRVVGRADGALLGRTAAPLELRRLALERGRCPVCGSSVDRTSERKRPRTGGDEGCGSGPGGAGPCALTS